MVAPTTGISLSRQQQGIVDGLLAGKVLKEIGYELGITECTVKHYLQNIRRKFAARTTAQMIARYLLQRWRA